MLTYSPKKWEEEQYDFILQRILEPGWSGISTQEWGETGTHHHAHFIYYASSRDTCDEKKRLARCAKWMLPPLVKTKKVTSMAGAINYLLKGNFQQRANAGRGFESPASAAATRASTARVSEAPVTNHAC